MIKTASEPNLSRASNLAVDVVPECSGRWEDRGGLTNGGGMFAYEADIEHNYCICGRP